MKHTAPLAFALLATLVAPPARATPRDESTLRDSLSGRAREKLDDGARLYKDSHFAEAREAFLAAYATSGDPRVLYNVAVCDKALGRYARAIATLKRSLTTTDRPLSPEYTQRVAETIATLSRYVAFVTVSASVEGAAITVDGEPLRENPLALETGTHTIVATKEGYDEATVSAVVKAGEDQRVSVPMELSSRPGVALVTCPIPRCVVRVGDETLGPSPATFTRTAGSYLVRAVVDDRTVGEQRVELANGKRVELVLGATAFPHAHLRVTTEHPDDTVTVDGRFVGRSGIDVELGAGEHRVLIARPSGAARQIDLLLRDGETRDLRVTLEDKRGISPWWFVGGGAILAAGTVATVVLLSSGSSSTRFEGSNAGTLNPYVVPAALGGRR